MPADQSSPARGELGADDDPRLARLWPALWSIVLGFFMILVDTTIVTVAIPRMQADLGTDLASLLWVTSAYLLAYAVPLLITGRLGDRLRGVQRDPSGRLGAGLGGDRDGHGRPHRRPDQRGRRRLGRGDALRRRGFVER
ncbi:hypothetical protein GCM10009625_15430 [Brachybacterium fresconis]|uniref:MFS family permease n=1 Tax=Brachybacterium fresconis TaxID=173363 RepID=A0ABS4YG14_9MICO|nr:MFS family permease [Brachybacterium fresconis]